MQRSEAIPSEAFLLDPFISSWRELALTALFLFSFMVSCAPLRSRPALHQQTWTSERLPSPLSYQWPLRHVQLLSSFGTRDGRFHYGVDIRGRRGGGDNVYAAQAGWVIQAGRMSGYGNMVSLRHADGFVTRYAHLRKIGVHKGEKIEPRQFIGIVGATGRATTAHLHFEIISPKGAFLDPLLYLGKAASHPAPAP